MISTFKLRMDRSIPPPSLSLSLSLLRAVLQ